MKPADILSRVDHTLLQPDCTWKQIMLLCDQAIDCGCASVCIPCSYVKKAAEYVNGRIPVCTVIGFPNGYSTSQVKIFESADAVFNGASEIDMVANIGWIKDGMWDDVEREIRSVREICRDRVLKVIVEACLLTRDEKIRACRAVSDSGADFIKTSTGFSTGGATTEDVELFRSYLDRDVRIKAAGGISSLEDAEALISSGADRLGSSRIVGLIQNSLEERDTKK